MSWKPKMPERYKNAQLKRMRPELLPLAQKLLDGQKPTQNPKTRKESK